MNIFLSDMETCFAYMLLLPVGHECFFIDIVGIFFEHNGSKVTKIIISDN